VLREVGDNAASYEALLALANFRAGATFDLLGEAERLSGIISKTTRDRLIGELAVAEL
jgi:hypothetical protein